MSAEGPKPYQVVYDAQNGLQYSFQSGYFQIPDGANGITALTGDVVATGPGSVAAAIQAGVIKPSMISTVATDTFTFPNQLLIQGQSGGGAAYVDFFTASGSYRILANTGSQDMAFFVNNSESLILQNGHIEVPGDAVVGDNTVAPSAALTVTSTVKGLLPPRMTTVQKNAISSPAVGLVVYDTDVDSLCEFTNATGWVTLGAGGGGSNKLLQTVPNAFPTDSAGLTSSGYDTTGMTGSITPLSTTSLIILTLSGCAELDNGGTGASVTFTVYENGVDIGPMGGFGLTSLSIPTGLADIIGAISLQIFSTHNSSLTPLTYDIQYKVSGGTLFVPTNGVQVTMMLQEVEA